LRKFLNQCVALETIVDFGDMQVFEGATTYPAILVMQKEGVDSRLRGNDEQNSSQPHINNTQKPAVNPNEAQASQQQPVIPAQAGIHQVIAFIDALKVGEHASLADVLTAPRQSTMQFMLSDEGWRLEAKEMAELRAKLMQTGQPLKEVCGSPYRGVLTGFNEAFVIDGKTKDKLITQDAKSAELLKPFLEGKDLKPWHVEPRDLWLIFTRRGVDIEQYPAIKQHLEQYKERLTPKPKDWAGGKWGGRKAGSYQWYEIQDTVDYYQAFEGNKIVYSHFSSCPKFTLDSEGFYNNDKGYVIPCDDSFLLGLLMSNVHWFLIKGIAAAMRGGNWRYELRSQYMETLPIPDASPMEQQAIADLTASIQTLAESRFQLEASMRHRIACDLGGSPDAKLNKKLHDWFMLDGVQFRKEIKKAFKADIPLAERSDWEAYLQSQAQEIADLNAQIHDKEIELNQLVYKLFQLTEQEVKLLQEVI